MNKHCAFFSLLMVTLLSCKSEKTNTVSAESSPEIWGKKEYLASPFVTAGERIYMVGHQDGSFADLGWHITGEMGGVWSHPIKLMDGFTATIQQNDQIWQLNKADSFVNYPAANAHIFKNTEDGLQVERWQMAAQKDAAIIVKYAIENTTDSDKDIDFKFTGLSDLRPTWLAERQNIANATDSLFYNADLRSFVAKDKENDWFAVFGADQDPVEHEAAISSNVKQPSQGVLSYSFSLKAKETKTITFVISGSSESEQEASEIFKNTFADLDNIIAEKEKFYKELAERSKLKIADETLQETFEWLKYNSQWLVQETPGIGRGIVAGIPDYPWHFGVDSEYALQGYLAIGRADVAASMIKILDSVSNAVNGNGRIIHEMSSNGEVFNPGNINETPQFATLLLQNYKWTGDEAFTKAIFPTVKKGLKWIYDEADLDKNGFPDGFGMMEIHGLDSEMIDVAAYTQKAFADAALLAEAFGESQIATEYKTKAEKLKKMINEQFWSEEFSSYADFRGTTKQALHLIDDAIVRADTLQKPWSVKELKATKAAIENTANDSVQPFVLHHNWVVNTPMEVGLADEQKAQIALKTAKQYVNPFGTFVTGIDRDETAGKDEASFKGSKIFSYTGAVMTLPTGVMAVAENNYGNPDEALDYINRMTRSFSYAFPGSMYEVSPDYGMIAQAWNIYGYAVPIVRQFFGIDPWAAKKEVIITPQFPSTWDEASLENVKIGDNDLSVYLSVQNGKKHLKITQSNANWTIKVKPLADQELQKFTGKTVEIDLE